MKLLNKEFRESFDDYLEIEDNQFSNTYNNMFHELKLKYRRFLVYFDKVLNYYLEKNSGKLNYSHIHFEYANDDLKTLLSEFIVVKLFYMSIVSDGQNKISDEVLKIQKLLEGPVKCPEGVKANSKQWHLMNRNREILRQKKKIFTNIVRLNPQASIEPKILINLLSKEQKDLSGIINSTPFCSLVKDIDCFTGVCLNSKLTYKEVNKSKTATGEFLFNKLENVILFDCESKHSQDQYNYNLLLQGNEFGAIVNHLILISFGKKNLDFSNLKFKLDGIETRFYSQPKFPNYCTYTILYREIEMLIDSKLTNRGKAKFFESNSSILWDTFIENILSYEGLYELISFKLKNIYSFVLNEEIKKYILDSIFLDIKSNLISEETRESLFELQKESIHEIKENLSLVLDSIIYSDWGNSIRRRIFESTFVLISKSVIDNLQLLRLIKRALDLKNRNVVISWYYKKPINGNDVLILDYRDAGRFPYNIKPNIFKNEISPYGKTYSLFLSMFFENTYEWAKYNLNNDYLKILENPLRLENFKWKDMLIKIKNDKPESRTYVDLDEESSYIDQSHISINVKLGDRRSKSYYPSELFIYKELSKENYSVGRIDCILNMSEDIIIESQPLEEIYEDFNIYEKLANIEKEQIELKVIWNRFGFDYDDSNFNIRLWKKLLVKLIEQEGVHFIYKKLKDFFLIKNINIVSENTFENVWLDLESDILIPRSKKMFINLCDFLDIPKSYIKIMLRKKNAERQATRSSNVKMNNLLKDLINSGYFNEGVDIKLFLLQDEVNYYKEYELDELGIDESNYIGEIEALVNLVKERVSLLKINKIEISE